MNSIHKPLEYKDGWPIKPTPPPKGMIAEVTRLRNCGKKRSAAESRGTAVVCEVRWLRNADDRGMAYRFRSQLLFLDTKAISGGGAGQPLFDPCVEEWTDLGIIVSGWEIVPDSEGKGSIQYYQMLLVKSALKGV